MNLMAFLVEAWVAIRQREKQRFLSAWKCLEKLFVVTSGLVVIIMLAEETTPAQTPSEVEEKTLPTVETPTEAEPKMEAAAVASWEEADEPKDDWEAASDEEKEIDEGW